MDIPVSRLNQRMALQLPAELPLGLVFVVGEVQLPAADGNGTQDDQAGEFYLVDLDYRLPCRLSERAAAEFRLDEGDMVRAGGHLVFEPVSASYYLLARDIERTDTTRPAAKPLAAIIADNTQREQAASLAPAELPPWVQRMAPPEVQPKPDVKSAPTVRPLAAGMAMAVPQLSSDWELLVDAEAAMVHPEAEPALAGLSDELIAFLSLAMDSEVEVEITPEIMTDLNTTGTTDRLAPEVLEALDLFEASVNQESQTRDQDTPQPELLADDPATSQEQVMARPAPKEETADSNDQQQGEQTITAEEMSEALRSAEPIPAAEAAGQASQPTGDAMQRQAAPRSTSQDTVPWYLALLIIIVVIVFLVMIVAMVLFADGSPVDFSLQLPQEIPFFN